MNLFAPVALLGFWILLVAGWMLRELGLTGMAVFVLLWLAGFLGSPRLLHGALFTPYVSVLDIALVLAIFKSDVTLR